MKDVHLVVGVLSIALNGAAGLCGAWRWWRAQSSAWFWRLLRSAQAVLVLQVLLGGLLVLLGHKPPSLHVVYGLLPLAVSFIGEQLRVASAQMVLDARGYESAAEVGELGEADQRSVVGAIVQREMGVMVLAALVIVVLLARAAATAG
ncbi:MAG: hypothetical protein ACR2OB_09285 [Solirubrobacteraceae bacterium]